MPVLKVHKKETSPYRALNQHILEIQKYAHAATKHLLSAIAAALGLRLHKADDDLLIVHGRVIYNPETGKPISKAQWTTLEATITKYLKTVGSKISTKAVHDSFTLGALLQQAVKASKRRSTTLSAVMQKQAPKLTAPMQQMIDIAEQSSGAYIQNVSDRARSAIQQVLVDGVKEKKSTSQVSSDLWALEDEINRDWDRVAQTEAAINANTAFVASALESKEPGEKTFMKGISAPNACHYCIRLVHDKVVVATPVAPASGETVKVKGKSYKAIWPGKSNIGRSPSNYWTALTIHPHCRCVWTEWDELLDE